MSTIAMIYNPIGQNEMIFQPFQPFRNNCSLEDGIMLDKFSTYINSLTC